MSRKRRLIDESDDDGRREWVCSNKRDMHTIRSATIILESLSGREVIVDYGHVISLQHGEHNALEQLLRGEIGGIQDFGVLLLMDLVFRALLSGKH